MRGAKEGVFAIAESRDERVVPILEQNGKSGSRGAAKPVCADRKERLLAVRLQQAERGCEIQNLTQPLQGVLSTVGDITAADEAFEQPHPRREQLIVADGHRSVRHASRARRPVAPRPALARDAGGQQRGPKRRRL